MNVSYESPFMRKLIVIHAKVAWSQKGKVNEIVQSYIQSAIYIMFSRTLCKANLEAYIFLDLLILTTGK